MYKVDDYGNKVNDLYPLTIFAVHEDHNGNLKRPGLRRRVWCGTCDLDSARLHAEACIRSYVRDNLPISGVIVADTVTHSIADTMYTSEVI